MTPQNPKKLHTTNIIDPKMVLPRRYTLTHSDSTGEIYLTVAHDYDLKQISGWYTRIMRDEILAE